MMKIIVKTIEWHVPNLKHLKPATAKQIKEAEKSLGLIFANEYKDYLAKFGAISGKDIELTGIATSPHIDVIQVTESEKELNDNIPQGMYVVENLRIDGIIIWQDKSGAIYQTQYESTPKKIERSLANYIISKYYSQDEQNAYHHQQYQHQQQQHQYNGF